MKDTAGATLALARGVPDQESNETKYIKEALDMINDWQSRCSRRRLRAPQSVMTTSTTAQANTQARAGALMAHHPAWVGHHTGGSQSKPTVHLCHFGGEAVRCSPTPQHKTVSPRKRNTMTTVHFFKFKNFHFFQIFRFFPFSNSSIFLFFKFKIFQIFKNIFFCRRSSSTSTCGTGTSVPSTRTSRVDSTTSPVGVLQCGCFLHTVRRSEGGLCTTSRK